MFYSDLTINEKNIIINCLECYSKPNYIEIGVYHGGTFLTVLEYLNNNKSDYYCCGVDLFENLIYEKEHYENRFLDNYKNSQTHIIFNNNKLNSSNKIELTNNLLNINKNYKFELLKGYSDDIIPTINQKFDVIFIDGNHTYEQTKKDFLSCYNHLSNINTFFIFHNTLKYEADELYLDGGPYKFCEELYLNNNLSYIGEYDRSKVFRRIL